MPNKAENEIQKEVLAYAKKHKDIAWIDRANSGKVKVKGGWMQLHEVGTPDLIGYSKTGVMIGIELKDVSSYNSKNNGCSSEQLKRIASMRACGCFVGIACKVEHVEEIMSKQ